MSTTYEVITANTLAMQTGQFGLKVATSATVLTDLSTTPAAEYFYGIVKAIQASVITLKNRASIYGDATVVSFPMAAGDIISGKFDLVTVISGTVLIYMGKEAVASY